MIFSKIYKNNGNNTILGNPFLDTISQNSFIQIISTYKERNHFTVNKSLMLKKNKPVKNDYLKIASLISPRSEIVEEHNTFIIKNRPKLIGKIYLKRKPKHIILILMESFAAWPLELYDNYFNKSIMPVFFKLQSNGILFKNHFHHGTGSIRNIQAILFSIGFPQNSVSFPQLKYGYKDFPDLLPKIMKRFGYASTFCYGTSFQWQRLYYF